tara:strand:- start:539 stop:946 length:408 start_codon:yes stop_codon:yes gene_type:complete
MEALKNLKSQVNAVLPREYWQWESDEEIIDIIKNLLSASEDDTEEINNLKEENEELRQFHEWDKIAALKWNEEKEKNEKLKEELEELKKKYEKVGITLMWWRECGYDSYEDAIVAEFGDQSAQARKYGFGVFKEK